MDPFTFALVVVAVLSEILPLLGFTKVNGILHGIQTFILHLHADSECHVNVDVDAHSGAAAGPAATAALAADPP